MQPATAKVKIRDTAEQNAEVYVEVPEARELKLRAMKDPAFEFQVWG